MCCQTCFCEHPPFYVAFPFVHIYPPGLFGVSILYLSCSDAASEVDMTLDINHLQGLAFTFWIQISHLPLKAVGTQSFG